MRTMELDAYVLETLMPDLVGHDHQPSAFLVYLYLWSRTRGQDADEVSASLQQIAEGVGISRRAVQDAVARLAQRQLIGVERMSITAVPRYRVHRPWTRWMEGEKG